MKWVYRGLVGLGVPSALAGIVLLAVSFANSDSDVDLVMFSVALLALGIALVVLAKQIKRVYRLGA